jgi:hypothetical protein
MDVIFLFLGAIGFGFLLIVLIAITSPRPQRIDYRKEASLSALAHLSSEDLGKVVAAILDKMGLEMDRWTGGPNEVLEIRAINPEPIVGGALLIHCITPKEDTGEVDGPMVGRFLRAVRSAYVSKGLLFTTGLFTPDARLAAEDAPIELFDRDQIGKLLQRYFGTTDPNEPIAIGAARRAEEPRG